MQKITCRVSPTQKNSIRLDQFIAASEEALKLKLSRTVIRKLIVAGAVYINGKRVRIASRPLRGGEIVDLYWDSVKQTTKADANQFLPLRILYEDDAVVCFDKPAGLPTQPTLDDARANLYQLAKNQMAELGKKYLGLHHRLDRDTSGVILFTVDKKHNQYFSTLFKEHQFSKLYVAIVHGKLKNQKGRLESYLAPVAKKGKRAKFGSVRSGGKKAITDYHVLASNENYSLVEVSIQTGRTHQIRVHFSEMGHPILGDTLYGSPSQNYDKCKRHMLHAHALTFEHPVTHGIVRVESPVPTEFRKWVSSTQ